MEKPNSASNESPPGLPISMQKDSMRRQCMTSRPCVLVNPVSTCFARALCQKRRPRISTHRSRPFGHISSSASSLPRCSFGSAVQRQAAAPRRAWQSVIPTLMATPDTDTLYNMAPQLRAQHVQLQTTLTTDEQDCCPFQATWFSLPPKSHESPQSNDIFTSSFLKASLHLLLTVLCSFPNLPHTPVPISCSRAVKRSRLTTLVSVLL